MTNKITIYITPQSLSEITTIVATEDRLDEFIAINTGSDNNVYGDSILIENGMIKTFPLWDDTKLPVLLPLDISFGKDNLLGVIFYLLGNYEKAYQYFKGDIILQACTEASSNLMHGEIVEDSSLTKFAQNKSDQTALHNLAIATQYGDTNAMFHDVNTLYKEALEFPLNEETREILAYTTKQYALFLADANLYHEAIEILEAYKENEFLSPLATVNVLALLTHLHVKGLSQPYNDKLIKQIKVDLYKCINDFKERELFIQEAFALMDASYIATIEQSYSEGLSYIQRAINLFEDAEIQELAANASLQKSDLLFTWAQGGNPQFYKAAMDACLDALKVFKREEAADIFADIHHKLGVIYSEILDEEKKRGIWTSVSVSSFKEALNFFTKENYPYEYALICNNQGNAFSKYPETVHSDNYAKALDWYNRSLEIRTADTFPHERAITLLNYIEAAWSLSSDSYFDESLFEDMMQKAKEVKKLNINNEFVMEADRHIKQLNELASKYK